jgi:hypothetical protein
MHNGCGYSRHRVGWTGPKPSQAAVNPYYRGLEDALIDSLSREALLFARRFMVIPNIHAVAFLRAKGGKIEMMPYPGPDWIDANSPIHQWFATFAQASNESAHRRYEFAAIVGIGRDRQPFVSAYALSPAIVGPLRDLEMA